MGGATAKIGLREVLQLRLDCGRCYREIGLREVPRGGSDCRRCHGGDRTAGGATGGIGLWEVPQGEHVWLFLV